MATYVYKPLRSPNNIRLLSLHGPPISGAVSGRLIEEDLDDASRKYEALSYPWGKDHRLSNYLLVDNLRIPITARLDEVLHSLAGSAPRTVWIDAICINQQNLEEKAQQIPLMYRIYRNAKRVLAWIGPSTPKIQEACRILPHLVASLQKVEKHKAFSVVRKFEEAQELLARLDPQFMMGELFQSEWFDRLWVVQEVVAANTIVYLCGNIELPMANLHELAPLLIFAFLGPLSKAERVSRFARILQLRSPQRNEPAAYKETAEKRQILDLLELTVDHQCSDARDRLFALGGMSVDTDALPYSADYSKQIETVFTDFAVHFVMRTQSYNFLSYARLGRSEENMATWIPDWRFVKPIAFSETMSFPTPGLVYRADGDNSFLKRPALFQGTQMHPVLVLPGFVVDQIETVWPPPVDPTNGQYLPASESAISISSHVGYIVEQLLLFLSQYEPHVISWETLWRTLLCDKTLSEGDDGIADPADELPVAGGLIIFLSAWQEHLNLINKEERSLSGEAIYTETIGSFIESQEERQAKEHVATATKTQKSKFAAIAQSYNDMKRHFRRSIISKSKALKNDVNTATAFGARLGRLLRKDRYHLQLCITKLGRLGWVPNTASCGDDIVIISSDVPMILRPTNDDSYMVVGESYIHGIMFGEAVQGAESVKQIRLV